MKEQIEAAFAGVQRPDDTNVVYDDTGGHLECNEVAAAFRGKHWKQVPLEVLRDHYSGLFFFTPEAYRFYLPAYLCAVLLHYEDGDMIPGSIVFSLIPPSHAGDVQNYRQRMDGFTSPQRNAIKSFLEFLQAQHPYEDPLGDLDRALASL